jgi:hypothetical protein
MYNQVPYIGSIGLDLKDSTDTSILTEIKVFDYSISDEFNLTPIDYSHGGTWKRFFLDAKYNKYFSYHGGIITLTFFSKLTTEQPLFYLNKTADSDYIWLTIEPNVASPYVGDSLASVKYRQARCIRSSMQQVNIGGNLVMMGTASWKYRYKQHSAPA